MVHQRIWIVAFAVLAMTYSAAGQSAAKPAAPNPAPPVAAPAPAQNAASAPTKNSIQAEPTAEQIAAAKQVLLLTKSTNRAMQIVDIMLPGVTATLKREHPDLSDKTLAMFQNAMREEMEKSLPQMLDAEAKIYAEHFSVTELRQLAAFYHTPLGQKLLTETPKIMQETIPLGRAWGMNAGMHAMHAAIDQLRKEGIKI